MSQMLQPTILLLREGTDTSQGTPQLISNINAISAITDTVRTTLGPRGMDKLVYSGSGSNMTISNDGATVLKLLDIVHPAARTLVDIAKSQDEEVGDGTTSVVVLAGEFLNQAKEYIEERVHPSIIIKAFRTASRLCQEKLEEMAFSTEGKDQPEVTDMLVKCAATALNSKLIGSHKSFFAPMIVDAVLHVDADADVDMVGIKKQQGGSMEDSFLVEGVAFEKTFSYAGFEQQPKYFDNPKILCLNIELELKRERDNAEIRMDDVEKYQSFVDAEWNIIYEKLDQCVKSGAQVVLSKLAIGDLGTQYFADRGLFCAGRVHDSDMKRISKATGAQVLSTTRDIIPENLGTCQKMEERQVGGKRYNVFSGCKEGKASTIVLRGGGEQFLEEMDRSVHDAIMIVRRARTHKNIVAGGGATEMELSKYLRDYARTIHGKEQLLINAYGKALEAIPRQIAENAGLDSTKILNRLRQEHYKGMVTQGVDINNDTTCDTKATFVWEPALVKRNSIGAATEAACMILSVDSTVKNPKAQNTM